MFGRYNPGNFNSFTYTSDYVSGEQKVLSGATETTLNWLPIIPGQIDGSLTNGDKVTDNGNGSILINGTVAGSINYTTGKITFNSAQTTTLSVNYTYSNSTVPTNAPKVTFGIKQTPIVAKWRTLVSLQSIFAQLNYNNEFGEDLSAYAAKYAAIELKHEIDGEIISTMANMATAPSKTINKATRYGINALEGGPFNLIDAIADIDSSMQDFTKMAQPTFYVVGKDGMRLFKLMPENFFKPSGITDSKGSYLLGSFGGKAVYFSPAIEGNKILAGFKGTGLFDAGLIFAPYIPIISTDYLRRSDFVAEVGFATAYGIQKSNSNFYSLSTFVDTPEVVVTTTA